MSSNSCSSSAGVAKGVCSRMSSSDEWRCSRVRGAVSLVSSSRLSPLAGHDATGTLSSVSPILRLSVVLIRATVRVVPSFEKTRLLGERRGIADLAPIP